MKLLNVLFLFSVVASLGQAAQVSVWGRDYTYSCGYFSSMQGDYDVTLQDSTLPWGTEVTLVAGWSGPGFEWRERAEHRASAVSGGTWRARVTGTLVSRGSAERRTGLDFTLRIRLPNGTTRWMTGGSSWGFYRLPVGGSSVSNCINSSDEKPAFRQMYPAIVHRN